MANTETYRRSAMHQHGNEMQNSPEQPAQQQETEIDLVGLMLHLLSKWYFIALAAIVCAVIAGVYSFRYITPIYEATSKLYVVNANDTAINLSDLQISNYLAKDYVEVFKNWHVHEMVLQELGLSYSYKTLNGMVKITNPSDTRILYITVSSSSPTEAKLMADTYAKVAKEFIAVKMDTREPNVFEEALLPTAPSSPNKTRNIMLGFLLGALVMCGIFVVQYIMDDHIRTADEIEACVGLPTLGVVPLQKNVHETQAPTTGKMRNGGKKNASGNHSAL